MNKIIIVFFVLIISSISYAEKVELEKTDYLTLIISNYVHGFKEFETSVTSFEDSVSVGIYYDVSTQSEIRANQLAKRFRTQIPPILNRYDWAKSVKIHVNVYSEDRANRGY
jgi:hypothetical protein